MEKPPSDLLGQNKLPPKNEILDPKSWDLTESLIAPRIATDCWGTRGPEILLTRLLGPQVLLMASVMQYRYTSPANISDTTEEANASACERERQSHNGMIMIGVAPDDQKKQLSVGRQWKGTACTATCRTTAGQQ